MYDLKALQAKEIEILQAIHDACEKMGIEYVIMHGTLLGAVRHKGFIPWDDDIDICMVRDSYDTFIREGHKYLPENLKIQHVSHEKACPNIFAKVRDCNTTFLHAEHVDLGINQGVFIDIFPVDRIKSSRFGITSEYYRKRFFNVINECFDLAYVKTIKRPMSKAIGYFVHYVINRGIMRGVDRSRFILREEDRRRRLHNRGDDCTFISIYKKITGKYSLFTERALYDFDGHKFYGPKNYDEVLSILYGDYMKVPPKEQQITHKPLFVDLERGYSKEEIDKMIAEGVIK